MHRRSQRLVLALLFALVTACARPAPSAPVRGRPIDYQPPLADAARTEILVLATAHLSDVEGCLDPAALTPLIDRLAAWQPDVIAVESLPATAVQEIARRDDPFALALRESFARGRLDRAAEAQQVLGLDAGQIRAELAGLSARTTLDPAARGRLIVLRIAAYEYPSAVLQWSYLDEAGRAASNVPPELAVKLDESLRAANEIYAIAVPLARARGLDALALVDDFFAEEGYAPRFEEFAKEAQASAELAATRDDPYYADSKRRLEAACRAPDQMLAYYEHLNSADHARSDVSRQWGVWFRTAFASGLDRARYASWEARNLAIAANIRKATALHPGKRVLAIYGAGHKPFLDAYLAQMLDVRVVQLDELLAPARR